MKRPIKKIASIFVLVLLCLAFAAVAAACTPTVEPDPEPKPPVKVSDGIDFELATGDSKNITVADYITLNGNDATAESDSANATCVIAEGLLTVTAVSEGDATVTLSCGDIDVTFGVTVYTAYSVSVDGIVTKVRKGETFVLPAAPTPADPNFEFDHWLVGEEQKAPADTITVDSDVTVTSVTKRKAAVKVKDGESITAPLGANKTLNVADYITTYGAEVSASSDDEDTATVEIADGKIVITPKAEGAATVTVSCGAVEIEFQVTVTPAPVITYTVTVDGTQVATVEAGGTYVLPAAATSADPDFEFVGWNVGGEIKAPGATITVDADIDITAELERKAAEKIADGVTINLSIGGTETEEIAVADYIATHGNTVTAASNDSDIATAVLNAGKITVTAVAEGTATVTLTCGEVTVTFEVNVMSADAGTPVFKNGKIDIDLFESNSGSCEFEITEPDGSNFSYEYTATPDSGVSISGNTLTYTAATAGTVVITVSVTATDSVIGTRTTRFNVTVTVTDSSPVVFNSEVTVDGTVDLYSGAYIIDLAKNIDNSQNVGSYKVDGAAVDGSKYTLTGDYTDTPTLVTLTVEGLYGDNKKVTYTYKVNVIDSTAYRMPNGGFDDPDHGKGWTGMNGTFSDHGKYFESTENPDGYPTNNDGYYYIGVEPATETITSPEFVVGNSGWITFKLGSMKPYDKGGIRNMYVEVVKKVAGGDDETIASVRNILFKDPERALRLNDYKLDLSSFKGETVYMRIVDNENGGDFRHVYLDSFNTWWDSEPSNEYTDLSVPYVLDTTVTVDLKESNAGTVNVDGSIVYSLGVNGASEFNPTVEITEGDANGIAFGKGDKVFNFTVAKCGTYKAVYKHEERLLFTLTVNVVNTTELPAIADIEQAFEYGDWFGADGNKEVSVDMPVPSADSGFNYAFDIVRAEGGASVESFKIENGALKYTPHGAGSVVITVETTVSYTLGSGENTATIVLDNKVTFTVTIDFIDNVISLKNGSDISRALDVNDAQDKEKLVIDFADHVNVPSGKTVTYSAKLGGTDIALESGSKYTVTFASEGLTDAAKEYVFAVTATEGDTTLEYTVTYSLTDTYQYRLVNGGFETGDLTGWTLDGEIGVVTNDNTYWNNPEKIYNKDGNYLFSWWTWNADANAEVNREGNTGTLTSDTFMLKQNGLISFKFGGGGGNDQIYIEVVRASDNTAIAKFYNSKPNDGMLIQYYYQFSGMSADEQCYIRVTDNATSGWGCLSLDSVMTYCTAAPDGGNAATNVIA